MKIHIVQKGDTLWKLAEKYNVDFELLKKANTHLSDPDQLMPGMKVKIPSKKAIPSKKETLKGKGKKDGKKPIAKGQKLSKADKEEDVKDKLFEPKVEKLEDVKDKVVEPKLDKAEDLKGKLLQPKVEKLEDVKDKIVEPKVDKAEDLKGKLFEPKVGKVEDIKDKVVEPKIDKVEDIKEKVVEPEVKFPEVQIPSKDKLASLKQMLKGVAPHVLKKAIQEEHPDFLQHWTLEIEMMKEKELTYVKPAEMPAPTPYPMPQVAPMPTVPHMPYPQVQAYPTQEVKPTPTKPYHEPIKKEEKIKPEALQPCPPFPPTGQSPYTTPQTMTPVQHAGYYGGHMHSPCCGASAYQNPYSWQMTQQPSYFYPGQQQPSQLSPYAQHYGGQHQHMYGQWDSSQHIGGYQQQLYREIDNEANNAEQ